MAAKAPPPPDFEKSLEELEGLVEQLEKGELSLEEALRRFERGIVLARSCQSALQAVEQKVEKLLAENGQVRTAPFDAQE